MNEKTNGTRPDLLIFDVDGVLIDTRDSYMHVTAEAIRWCWENVYGGTADGEGYTLHYFNLCKTHPSFNDDSAIAWAFLQYMEKTGKRSMKEAFPSLAAWAEELKKYGRKTAADEIASTKETRISLDEIRTVTDEIYLGKEAYREFKNIPARGISDGGLWTMERPSLDRHWTSFGMPVAIYTGRSPDEMTLARRQLDWQDFPQQMVIDSGSGILKPSPQGLQILCDRAQARQPLFFGDTASDRESWKAFGKGLFVAIGPILSGRSPHFATLGEALSALSL